jgi:hypothetical protein
MVEVAPGTIVVFSDIGCPWAHVAVWRLHDARRRLGLEGRVAFDHRVFPLELFNSQPTPRDELAVEWEACAALTPRAGWQAWNAPDDSGRARHLVFEQYEVARSDAVDGSPHLFLADGTNVQNPGIEATWDEGSDGFWRPTIVGDDPNAYDQLLSAAVATV